MLALGIVIPVLPKLVLDFVGGDAVRGADYLGLFGTAWALMQFLFSPIHGALSDRFGRRPIILLSNFGLGLDYILMALAPSLAWLFVGRIISGITAASISTAYAYVADVTEPDKRAARFGMLGVAFGVGFVLGPALGGIAGSFDPRLPFWIAAGLSLLNGVYGLFILPESLPPEKRAPVQLAARQSDRLADPVALASATDGARGRQLPRPSRACEPAEHRRALHDVPLQLERAHRRLRDGGRRPLLDDRAGRTDRPGGEAFRRAPGDDHRARLRRRRLCGVRTGGDRVLVPGRHSAAGAVGHRQRRDARADEPSRRPSEQGQLQGANASLMGIANLIGPGIFTQSFALFIGAGAIVYLPGAPFLLAAIMLAAAIAVAVYTMRETKDEKSA